MKRAIFGAAFAVVIGSLVGACMLVTGSTDGYVGVDAGAAGFEMTCLASANCAAPQKCCLSSSGSVCALDCTAIRAVQLCAQDNECGASADAAANDAGTSACVHQACTVAGQSQLQPIRACGIISGCNPIP